MSSEIVINDQTTVDSLFKDIYDNHQTNFPFIYADLISNHPEFEELIKQAWVQSTMTDMQFKEFRNEVFKVIAEQGNIFDEDEDDF